MNEIDDSADRLFFRARACVNDGRIVDARNLLEDCVAKYPTHGRSYCLLGWIQQKKYEDFDAAERYFLKAAKYAADYPTFYKHFASCLSQLRKFDRLEALLNEALKLKGIEYSVIYEEFAIMYELMGNYDLAIHYFAEAAKSALSLDAFSTLKGDIDRCEQKRDFVLKYFPNVEKEDT